MSKVASTAGMLGVDVDSLNAQIATVVATTRLAPESVGTAFKTISGFLQNAVKFIIEQLSKKFPKIGSAASKVTSLLDDVLKGIAGATGKAAKWVGEKVGKLMAWISAKTGLDAAAIGFAITGAQVTLGALNNAGKAGAAKLFLEYKTPPFITSQVKDS